MNEYDTIRNALANLLCRRANLDEAQRSFVSAELALGRAGNEAKRQLCSKGNKPVLFRGVMYSVERTPADRPDVLHEKPMSFIDLSEKE